MKQVIAAFLSIMVAVASSACQAPDSEGAGQTVGAAAGGGAAATDPSPDPRIRDLSGFALWSAEELSRRNEALSTQIGQDFSARETLEHYGNHWFRFIRRDRDGRPEQHDDVIDVVIVQSGRGVLLVGGVLIDPVPPASGFGTWMGSGIEGGDRFPLVPGDVMHIPADVPHAFLVPEGEHFTYVLVKFPAP